jgi:outer membrane protein W
MKSRLLFCLIPLAGLSAASSFAAEEATSPDWIIHARGISVSPNAKSILPLGVKSKIAPELDFTRMFGPTLGLRPSEEAEREGLDISEHGERAYNY